MIRNISDEEARHMVELLKKKSVLIKNFSHKLEKYRISGDREMYDKMFDELLEKEDINSNYHPSLLFDKQHRYLPLFSCPCNNSQ